MRRWLLTFVAIAALAFASLSPVGAAEPDDESQFVALINDLRSSLGLQPLQVDPELVGPSRDWAAQLSNDGALSHAPDLSVGVTSDWTMLGENVGVASVGQTQALFDAFVASPGHYENLINPDFRFVGVGVVYDSAGQMWTTHRFMAVGQAPISSTTAHTTAPPTTPTTAAPVTTAPPPTSVPSTPSSTTDVPPLAADSDPSASDPPERLAFTDGSTLTPGAIVSVIETLDRSGV